MTTLDRVLRVIGQGTSMYRPTSITNALGHLAASARDVLKMRSAGGLGSHTHELISVTAFATAVPAVYLLTLLAEKHPEWFRAFEDAQADIASHRNGESRV